MSEKRYKMMTTIIDPFPIWDTVEEKGYNCTDTLELLVDLLNNLTEENERLKEARMNDAKEFSALYKQNYGFKRENEQLKNDDLLFFQQVFDILMKYQHLFNREMADEVLEDLGIELTEWFE